MKLLMTFTTTLTTTLLWAATLCVGTTMSGAWLADLGVTGLAAHAEEDEEKPMKTRRVPSMSEQVFKKLSEAQEAIDLKDYVTAENVLRSMLDRSRRYNGNEIGQVHNMLGFVAFTKEDYNTAINEYKLVIAQGEDIPEGLEVTTIYTLAQLSFVAERYQDALDYMELWITKANNPGPSPHIFMGQVYYQMKNFGAAITQIETGIRKARERGTPLKEQWWSLLNYLYYEQENWDKMIEILEILVRDFPKREYWIRLAGIHGQEGRSKEQAYTMEAAYTAGFITRERDIINLAGLLLQEEVPFRAAKVLEQGFKDKNIERTDKNLRALGQAWQLSQEVNKAIPAYEEAGRLSDDGKILERLAHLYLDADRYGECVDAADSAINKGGLRKVQAAYVIRGMCLYNQDKLSSAKESFSSCRNESRRVKDASNQRICQQWMTFIEREGARREQLAASS